jgi:hypothetical protein
MDDTFVLQFTSSELSFLGSAIKAGPDFQGTASMDDHDSRAAEWRAAQTSLGEKGIVRQTTSETEIILDTTAAAMVSVLGFPDSALSVSTMREKAVEPETWQLCISQGLIVDQHKESVENHILTAYRTYDFAIERLLGFLDLKQQATAYIESFSIATEVMAQLPYIIAGNGREDGATFLLDKGVPEQAASRLAAALDNPVQQSLIQAVIWIDGEPQEVGHLTLLEEVYGLWMILPSEEDDTILEIATCTAKEASERIRALAYQVLPPELA